MYVAWLCLTYYFGVYTSALLCLMDIRCLRVTQTAYFSPLISTKQSLLGTSCDIITGTGKWKVWRYNRQHQCGCCKDCKDRHIWRLKLLFRLDRYFEFDLSDKGNSSMWKGCSRKGRKYVKWTLMLHAMFRFEQFSPLLSFWPKMPCCEFSWNLEFVCVQTFMNIPQWSTQ